MFTSSSCGTDRRMLCVPSCHRDTSLTGFVSAWHWELLRSIPLLAYYPVAVVQKPRQIPPPPRPLLCITGTICHPSRATAVSLQSHLLLYTKKVSPCKLYSRHSFTTHCQTREKAASFHVQVFCRILNNYLCYPLHTCAPSDSDNTVTHHKSPAAGRGAVPTMVLCSCHTLFPQGNLLTAARSLAQRKKTFWVCSGRRTVTLVKWNSFLLGQNPHKQDLNALSYFSRRVLLLPDTIAVWARSKGKAASGKGRLVHAAVAILSPEAQTWCH